MKETKFNLIIVFLVASSSLFSCSRVKEDNEEMTYSFEIEKDNVFIDIPSTTSPNLTYPVLWDSLGDEYFAAYNFQVHGLDIFNLSQRRYVKQVKFSTEGPDFVSSVQAISIWSEGIFLVVNDAYITLVNFAGRVIDRLSINAESSDFTGFDFSSGRLLVNRHSGLQFSGRQKTILMEAYRFAGDSNLGQGFVLVELDIENRTIGVVDIPYESSLLNVEESYGELNGLNFLKLENKLVLNHKFSSEVFIWKGGKLQSRNVLSSFTVNEIQPFSRANGVTRESRQEYELKSSKFFPLVFDPNRDLYYRLHRSQLENINDQADFYITVMDVDFQKIGELLFPEGYYIFPIVSREGLLFLAFNKHDDRVELLNINVQLN